MDISVVIPVYNEVETLPELHQTLSDTLDRLPQSAEIVFVDDGSTDGSGAVLDDLAHLDARVQILHFRRNYGQTAALMAAFQRSTGSVVIPMDGDGQNDPVIFLAYWTSSARASMWSPGGACRATTNFPGASPRSWRTVLSPRYW